MLHSRDEGQSTRSHSAAQDGPTHDGIRQQRIGVSAVEQEQAECQYGDCSLEQERSPEQPLPWCATVRSWPEAVPDAEVRQDEVRKGDEPAKHSPERCECSRVAKETCHLHAPVEPDPDAHLEAKEDDVHKRGEALVLGEFSKGGDGCWVVDEGEIQMDNRANEDDKVHLEEQYTECNANDADLAKRACCKDLLPECSSVERGWGNGRICVSSPCCTIPVL